MIRKMLNEINQFIPEKKHVQTWQNIHSLFICCQFFNYFRHDFHVFSQKLQYSTVYDINKLNIYFTWNEN